MLLQFLVVECNITMVNGVAEKDVHHSCLLFSELCTCTRVFCARGIATRWMIDLILDWYLELQPPNSMSESVTPSLHCLGWRNPLRFVDQGRFGLFNSFQSILFSCSFQGTLFESNFHIYYNAWWSNEREHWISWRRSGPMEWTLALWDLHLFLIQILW